MVAHGCLNRSRVRDFMAVAANCRRLGDDSSYYGHILSLTKVFQAGWIGVSMDVIHVYLKYCNYVVGKYIM